MKPEIRVPQTNTRTNVTLAIKNEDLENPDTSYPLHGSSERANEAVQNVSSLPSMSSYNHAENRGSRKTDDSKTDILEIVISLAPIEMNLIDASVSETADILPSPSASEVSSGTLYEKIESPTSSCLTDTPIEGNDYVWSEGESVVPSLSPKISNIGQKPVLPDQLWSGAIYEDENIQK
ncbi:10889_t:CDS:2 [Acaulospora colombiana]|uniref:10889_t:CDS:1 n=1 Tax=Acaulospora colombiana TaxID=27376 RepID=A0ACA9JYV2_9GLOM|nr:10889_t:CDS:2 [Acaulospora colombiana]